MARNSALDAAVLIRYSGNRRAYLCVYWERSLVVLFCLLVGYVEWAVGLNMPLPNGPDAGVLPGCQSAGTSEKLLLRIKLCSGKVLAISNRPRFGLA